MIYIETSFSVSGFVASLLSNGGVGAPNWCVNPSAKAPFYWTIAAQKIIVVSLHRQTKWVCKLMQKGWLFRVAGGLMLLLLAGCQNIPFVSDTEPKRASLDEVLLEQVQFYRPYEIYNADFEAQLLGSARGIDCQQGWNDDAPEQRSALLALKADVLNAGGNAVVLTHCQTVELNQCNAAIQCDGTGYVVDEEQRKQQQSSNSPLDKPDIWF